MITFVVDAVPVPQPRARATTVGGHARMYEAPKANPIHEFKFIVRATAKLQYTREPMTGPVDVDIVFILPRPKNKYWKRKKMPRYKHSLRGDIDNYAKAILDALNGVIWHDDGQVFRLHASKWVAAGDESPHCEIRVYGKDDHVEPT